MPENRHRDALALPLTIRDNLIVLSHKRPGIFARLWFRRDVIGIADVRGSGKIPRAWRRPRRCPVSSLSGGNQQKLVLGRELEQAPALLVAHNPFRGLDVRAIQDVRDAIFGACKSGSGVVMISSDLDELVQLAHRIVVLFAGRIAGEVDIASEGTRTIGRLMGGVAHDHAR